MKTALLVCDHVLPQFQRDHGTYPEMFTNLFPDLDLEHHFVCDGDFPDVEDFDAYIISGSRYSVYDDKPWIKQLKDFTQDLYNSKKKVLGVCFGHQMIAEALGGKVLKAENGFLIGVHEFEILEKKFWMEPFQDHYYVLMLCQDQVEQLPSNAQVLSKSLDCSVAMFSVGDYFLGVQGHPEFTRAYNRVVIESRTEQIGQDKIDFAIESFKIEPNTELVRDYLMGFLMG